MKFAKQLFNKRKVKLFQEKLLITHKNIRLAKWVWSLQEMPDEVLVFDLETNKAHCLNQTAAFVWKACDGVNSVAEIAKLFGNKLGIPVKERKFN